MFRICSILFYDQFFYVFASFLARSGGPSDGVFLAVQYVIYNWKHARSATQIVSVGAQAKLVCIVL